ncbi:MAG: nuclear transport factor 2 family protein [Catenulispora sp.]|nr:nuclear transport factor 2 family protein [Catenulispora sp.]
MNSITDDKLAVTELCTTMMWYVDVRDWATFPAVFADKVTLDYTSIYGGEPWQQTPAEITAMWSKLLNAFDATQHLLGNHLVTIDGDTGELTAVFQATHLLANRFGSPLWRLGGTYRFGVVRTLLGWRIDKVTMTATWAEGNKEILTLAQAAADAPESGQ